MTFAALGWEGELDWYRGMPTGKFEATVKGRIGPGKADEKSMRVLNRMVHWAPTGIEHEADQRRAEVIVAELGLATGS